MSETLEAHSFFSHQVSIIHYGTAIRRELRELAIDILSNDMKMTPESRSEAVYEMLW